MILQGRPLSLLSLSPPPLLSTSSSKCFFLSNPKTKCRTTFLPSLPLAFFLSAPSPLASSKLPPTHAAFSFFPPPHCLLAFLPADPWSPSVDSQSIASQLFAASLFPYLGFLYHLTKSKSAPKLTLFGFYFLLVFVGVTIPAGIYAKLHYGTSLANVDWLHGGAESTLTLTNLFIVLGLRRAIRDANDGDTVSKEEQEETAEDESLKLLK